MNATVNENCIGCGLCAGVCPEVFSMGDDGFAHGGEIPADDDKVYGVTTLDFLLNGGDGLHVQKNALSVQVLDGYVIDIVLPYVQKLMAEGKPIEYHTDGRIKIVE